MSLVFGGTTVNNVVFNGTTVDRIVFNGVDVYTSGVPDGYLYLNGKVRSGWEIESRVRGMIVFRNKDRTVARIADYRVIGYASNYKDTYQPRASVQVYYRGESSYGSYIEAYYNDSGIFDTGTQYLDANKEVNSFDLTPVATMGGEYNITVTEFRCTFRY